MSEEAVDEKLIDWMRAHGVRRVTREWPTMLGNEQVTFWRLTEIELCDTLPAPVLAFEPDEPAPEEKPPGICVHPGCGEKNGWQFAREFCRDHGLAAAGVTRAR